MGSMRDRWSSALGQELLVFLSVPAGCSDAGPPLAGDRHDGALVGDQLWLTAGYAAATLYAGTPGASFRAVGTLCNFASIATDSCGRLVQLGTMGDTAAGVALGFFARPIGWASPSVPFGGVTGSAIAGAASTFGLLWYARVGPGVPEFLDAQTPGSLSFTTLSWGSP